MKIRRNRLQEIIDEELQSYLDEVALCHNSKGHFDSCEKGEVYSLTKKGAADNDIDPAFAKRGIVTKKQKRKPPKITAKFGINTSKKKSAGRKLIGGDDISPKYSVRHYPEKYKEELSPETGLPLKSRYKPSWPSSKKRKRDDAMGKPDRVSGSWCHGHKELMDLAKMKGLQEKHTFTLGEIISVVQGAFTGDYKPVMEGNQADACRRLGFMTLSDAQTRILKSLNNFALAKDGKLFAKGDKR